MADCFESMKPIVEIVTGQMRTSLEGEVFRAVQNVGVNVDKNRLLQALNDARSFYAEGFRAGQKSVDAVEVVRCKDCKSYVILEDGWYYCDCFGGLHQPDALDYCSYGERRADNG